MDNDSFEQSKSEIDPDMRRVLDDLLSRDEDITARAVARLHPRINATTSITRHA
jgi:hypothetical protein